MCTYSLHRVLAPAFNKWKRRLSIAARNELQDAHEKLNVIREAMIVNAQRLASNKAAGLSTRSLRRIWYGWSALARARGTHKVVRNKLISALRLKVLLRPQFRAWSRLCLRHRKFRRLLSRRIANAINEASSHALREWHHFVEASKRDQRAAFERHRAAKKVLLRMMSFEKSLAFSKWVQKIYCVKRAAATLGRAWYRRANDGMAGAFTQWIQFTNATRYHERRIEQSANRIRKRILHLDQAKAFSAWTFNVAAKTRFRILARRTVKRMFKSRCAIAFNTWTSSTAEKRREEHVRRLREHSIERCRRHLRFALSGKALRGWRASVVDRKRMRRICFRVLSTFRDGALSKALRTWWANTLSARKTLEEEARVFTNEKNQERMLDTCRKRIRHFLASRAFSTWKDFLWKRRGMRKTVRRAVLRLNAGLLQAFEIWVRAVHLSEASERRYEVLIEKCRRHMRRIMATHVMRRWKQFRQHQSKMRKVVTKILITQTLARAVGKWTAAVTSSKRIERATLLVVRALRRRQLSATRKVLGVWARSQFAGSRLHTLMTLLARRRRREGLASALLVWSKRNSQRTSLIGLVRLLVAFAARGLITTAFCTWVSAVLKQRRQVSGMVTISLSSQAQSTQAHECNSISARFSEPQHVAFRRGTLWHALVAQETGSA